MSQGRPLSAKDRAKFLEVLAQSANVTRAAKAIGRSRQALYKAREHDEAFAEAWAEAIEEAHDALEAEAWRRAVDGTAKPVYQGGACVGTVQEYSDGLMTVLLKAHRPEKYKDRSESTVKHTGLEGLFAEIAASRTSRTQDVIQGRKED